MGLSKERSGFAKAIVVYTPLLFIAGILAYDVRVCLEGSAYSLTLLAGAFLVALASILFVATTLRQEAKVLAARPQLLVPVLWAVAIEWFLNQAYSIRLVFLQATLSQPSSLEFLDLIRVLSFFIWTFCLGWTISLLVRLTTESEVDVLTPLGSISEWFPQSLIVVLLGDGVVFLLGHAFTPLLTGNAFFWPLYAVAILVWNMLTFALLVFVIYSNLPVFRAVYKGIEVSIKGLNNWWHLVLIHSVLVGWLVYMPIDLSARWTNTEHVDVVNAASINPVWVGGMEVGSRWLSKMLAGHATFLDLEILWIAGILLVPVAVLVKLKVARDLHSLTMSI